MRLLVKNIGKIVGIETAGRLRLCGGEMDRLETLDDAWLLADDGRIAAFGRMETLGEMAADRTVDAEGGMLFPSFCDSHTHLVYAGSREQEFLDKINGLSYEEIARRGGGILNSADLLHETSEEELYAQAMERVREIAAKGTGCVEIKSGYGLTTEDELKMLRVIRRIRETAPLAVCATFLGAHAVPRSYIGRQEEYVELVCNEMLPAVAAGKLADFVDVFCDEGFFTVEQTARIMKAGRKLGMQPKIHANELAVSGGVQVGVEYDALSVDHLERMGEAEIRALRGAVTSPTMLPGAAFFLGMSYPPAREMIRAGLGVALCCAVLPTAAAAVPFAAFLGAFAGVMLVLLISEKAGASRMTLVLAGVAISGMFGAGIDAVLTVFPDSLIGYSDFRIGGLANLSMGKVAPAAWVILLCLGAALALANEMDVLALGADTARSLGLRVRGVRVALLALAAALAGAAVSFAGLLGFVGLVAPHMVRRLVGGESRRLLAGCALGGAALLTVCDVAARTLFAPYELPVGVVLSLAGGPFFLWLLFRKGRGHP